MKFKVKLRRNNTIYVILSLLSFMVIQQIYEPKCKDCQDSGDDDGYEEGVWWKAFMCGKYQHPLLEPLELPVLFRDITPSVDKYNIYLVESSCVRRPAYRSICSVESYAQQNPEADIWYVLITSKSDNPDGLLTMLPRKYPNLHVVSADLDLLFRGLPTYPLFESQMWMKSHWLEIHLSDMMRLALLGQTGGFFSDTDTVCLKDVTSLKNFVGLGTKSAVNNAIFHFDRDHPVLLKNLEMQNENFTVDGRGTNGLVVMRKVVEDFCGLSLENSPKKIETCPGLHLMPINAFYSIHFKRWSDIFKPHIGEKMLEEISSSYVLHTWSGITALSPIYIDSGSLYDLLSSTFCPLTKEAAKASSRDIIHYYGEALPGRAWHQGIGKP